MEKGDWVINPWRRNWTAIMAALKQLGESAEPSTGASWVASACYFLAPRHYWHPINLFPAARKSDLVCLQEEFLVPFLSSIFLERVCHSINMCYDSVWSRCQSLCFTDRIQPAFLLALMTNLAVADTFEPICRLGALLNAWVGVVGGTRSVRYALFRSHTPNPLYA